MASDLDPESMPNPECHILPATKYVPNSPLPLLIYRDVLPKPITTKSCQEMIESHGWTRQVSCVLSFNVLI
jgi:uncharacterized protein YjlB